MSEEAKFKECCGFPFVETTVDNSTGLPAQVTLWVLDSEGVVHDVMSYKIREGCDLDNIHMFCSRCGKDTELRDSKTIEIPDEPQTQTIMFGVHDLTDKNRTSPLESEPTCQWCQGETASLVYMINGNTILEICEECHEGMANQQ